MPPKKGNKNQPKESDTSSDTEMEQGELLRRLSLLEKTVENQAAKIALLESTVALKSSTIDALKTHIDSLEARVSTSEPRIEALEQYGRRTSLRIHGVKSVDDESDEDVVKVVEKVAQQIGVDISRDDIFRAHRVGKEKKLDNGTATKQIIVKWRSWNARCAFFRARPTLKKPLKLGGGDQKCFSSISMDLTKQRLELLDSARKKIAEKYPGTKEVFAFANINCRLAIRFAQDNVKYFSSMGELDTLFKK